MSPAEQQRKIIAKYEAFGVIDQRLLAAMKAQYQYANTIDPELALRAHKLLHPKDPIGQKL